MLFNSSTQRVLIKHCRIVQMPPPSLEGMRSKEVMKPQQCKPQALVSAAKSANKKTTSVREMKGQFCGDLKQEKE